MEENISKRGIGIRTRKIHQRQLFGKEVFVENYSRYKLMNSKPRQFTSKSKESIGVMKEGNVRGCYLPVLKHDLRIKLN